MGTVHINSRIMVSAQISLGKPSQCGSASQVDIQSAGFCSAQRAHSDPMPLAFAVLLAPNRLDPEPPTDRCEPPESDTIPFGTARTPSLPVHQGDPARRQRGRIRQHRWPPSSARHAVMVPTARVDTRSRWSDVCLPLFSAQCCAWHWPDSRLFAFPSRWGFYPAVLRLFACRKNGWLVVIGEALIPDPRPLLLCS